MIDNFKNKTAALALSLALIQPQGLAWAAEAAMLEGIEVQPDQVTLTLSEQVRYTTFVTVEPPRLVVELADTEFAASSKMEAGKGDLLERVRAGQYQREPSLITRVVFDLKRLSAYRASWAGNRLQLRLAEGPFEESTDPQRAAQAPAADDPEAAAVAKAAAAAAAAAAPEPTPAPEKVSVLIEPTVPEKPAAKPAAAKLMAKAVDSMRDAAKPKIDETLAMTTENSNELAEIAEAGDTNPAAAAKGEKKKTAKVATMKDTGMRRDIIATLPTEPITIDFDNMDIGDILKLLATKAKINIVYGSDVAGMVTLHLVGVPFNEAFMTILSMQGLVANQVGENILRVMTPDILSKERATSVNQTRVIRLKYAKADEIVSAVTAVRAAEKRTGGVVVDQNTNSLVITDTLDGIASVERLLSQLDVRPQQVLIEAKLVEVNLSKDLAHGVQWDYFSNETSKLAGQQGRNFIGSIAAPQTGGTTTQPTKPFDQNAYPVGATTAGFPGASGRGTGVGLPAQKIFGAFTWGRVANNYF